MKRYLLTLACALCAVFVNHYNDYPVDSCPVDPDGGEYCDGRDGGCGGYDGGSYDGVNW